jgi:hypothetical protein
MRSGERRRAEARGAASRSGESEERGVYIAHDRASLQSFVRNRTAHFSFRNRSREFAFQIFGKNV